MGFQGDGVRHAYGYLHYTDTSPTEITQIIPYSLMLRPLVYVLEEFDAGATPAVGDMNILVFSQTGAIGGDAVFATVSAPLAEFEQRVMADPSAAGAGGDMYSSWAGNSVRVQKGHMSGLYSKLPQGGCTVDGPVVDVSGNLRSGLYDGDFSVPTNNLLGDFQPVYAEGGTHVYGTYIQHGTPATQGRALVVFPYLLIDTP